jgi:ribosomal protein S18 acetylase RimI-like enzyme
VRERAPAAERPERDRAVAAVLTRHAAAVDRVETWAGGRALLAPALPDLWDANHLILERRIDLDARGLGALAGRILGDGGARHRAVVVPGEAQARRLAPGFVDLGWDRDRLVLMALRGTPRARPGGPPAQELHADALSGLRREMVMLEPWGSRGVAAQLDEHQRRLRAAFQSRCFAACEGGRAVASCELFCADGVAEVADVGTLPDHRRRGLARAVVVAASRAARAANAELVIVTADADDWPRQLYARLGFEPLGLVERFRRVGLDG